MELVKLLAENLNIGEDQAKGGAGLIFKLAQEKLGDGDFAQITQHVPEMASMLEAAPEDAGIAGALGGLASSLGGGKVEAMGNMAQLIGGFSKLGLDEGAVTKFIPIVLSFLEGKGGSGIKDLLAKVL